MEYIHVVELLLPTVALISFIMIELLNRLTNFLQNLDEKATRASEVKDHCDNMINEFSARLNNLEQVVANLSVFAQQQESAPKQEDVVNSSPLSGFLSEKGF